MSMTCTVYKCDCPNNVVDKTDYLENATVLTHFDPYEAIDDLSGYILTDKTYDAYNYVKITSITGQTRYYFITSRELMPGQRCKMNLEEDVLMTWENVVMNTEGLIERCNVFGGTKDKPVGPNKDYRGNLPALCFNRVTELSSDPLEYGENGRDFYYVLVTASKGSPNCRKKGGTVGEYGSHSGGGGGSGW